MSLADADVNTYDQLAFPGQPVTQSHPARMAAVGLMFGMQPPPVERCRVLELGCAVGGNLVPLAEAYPHSTFVGIDYSRGQIETGRSVVASLGLANLELKLMSIAQVDERLGQFDYIICHGVFSWVAHDLQDKILAICRERLAAQGIAYVSFNAYPGWHFRQIIRQVLLDRAGPQGGKPEERMAGSRGALEFLKFAFENDQRSYARLLKRDLDSLLALPDAYLFHEYLEEENEPLYFHEFVARLPEHGLQYLGDATPANMFAERWGQEVAQRVFAMGADVVSVEQHLDLLREATFRQSLVCHEGLPLARQLMPERATGLYFAGDVRPAQASVDPRSGELTTFLVAGKWQMVTTAPIVKAAFLHLGRQWPRAVSLEELGQTAVAILGRTGSPTSEERELLAIDFLGRVVMARLDIFGAPSPFVIAAGEQPLGSASARQQAASGGEITSRQHELVRLDPFSSRIFTALDGRHTRADLAALVAQAADRGQIPPEGQAALAALERRSGQRDVAIMKLVDHTLADFARLALLIA